MNPGQSFLAVWSPRLLSVLRIVVAALYIEHGTAKFLHVPQVEGLGDVQLLSLLGLAGVLEIVGGLLVLIGLFTRVAAFVLSGEMAVAYFMAHAPQSWSPLINEGEAAVMYCFVFLYFAVAGGGPWSLDARLRGSA